MEKSCAMRRQILRINDLEINAKYQNKTPLDFAYELKNEELISILCKQQLHYCIWQNNSMNNLTHSKIGIFKIKVAKSLLKIVEDEKANLSFAEAEAALTDKDLKVVYNVVLKR